MKKFILFSTQSYAYLAGRVLAAGQGIVEAGNIERSTFPDGETYHRFLTPLNGKDVVILGGTCDDQSTMELYDLACNAHRDKARSITLLVPYFGYSTMERRVKDGEDVKAKNRARLLSSLQKPDNGLNIVMLDLHVGGIEQYFEGPLHTHHLYAEDLILSGIRELAGDKPYVLGTTDGGRVPWVRALARKLGVRLVIALKERKSGEETETFAVLGDVAGQHIVMCDDMFRTCGTAIKSAKAYKLAGASKITAVATHGLFPGNAMETLFSAEDHEQKTLIEGVVVTDSHPRVVELAQLDVPFIKVKSINGLLVDFLRKLACEDTAI